jgi:hypothetical protein
MSARSRFALAYTVYRLRPSRSAAVALAKAGADLLKEKKAEDFLKQIEWRFAS